MVAGFNKFPDIADALPQVISQIVRKTAFDGQANIQSQIRSNGQIDTGFMVNSVYVVTSQESTYQGGSKALPEVERPPDNQSAYIAVAANYGIDQNYGTRYLPARPFFEPGIEATRSGFEEAMSRLEDALKGAIGE